MLNVELYALKTMSEVSSFKNTNLFMLAYTYSINSNIAVITSHLKAIIAQLDFHYCPTLQPSYMTQNNLLTI